MCNTAVSPLFGDRMIKITYLQMVMAISVLWIAVRAFFALRNKKLIVKRELQLILVYICLIVVARFTFCPLRKVDGVIQPLLFDPANILPFRINLIPFVNLFDYDIFSEAIINFIGNTAMFIPLGIVWPAVFKELDTPLKTLAAGAGLSLFIEILQLPFYDRVSDVDDLLLNTLGFAVGYGVYRLVARINRKRRC
jgi:glycopeptide antibiotics resistance protein